MSRRSTYHEDVVGESETQGPRTPYLARRLLGTEALRTAGEAAEFSGESVDHTAATESPTQGPGDSAPATDPTSASREGD